MEYDRKQILYSILATNEVFSEQVVYRNQGPMRMKAVNTIIVIFILFCTGPHASARDKVRLTSGEWPPYTSKDLPHYGLMSQIVTEAFDLMGIDAEYTFSDSWKRSFIQALNGKFDGSLTWISTPKRKKNFYFCNSPITLENVFFHLKNLQFDWHTLEDLKPFRISVTSSYSYGKKFDTAIKSGKLTPYIVYNDITNILNLLHGRIEICPMNKEVGYALIRKHLPPEEQARITHHPKSLEKIFPTVIISKQIDLQRAEHLVTTFNTGLKRLKQSGRYEKIHSQFQR
ncbi:MAG: amino acid ABC transporter substrate-binding protein [Desulfobacteraceae bacterium]|nr:amino acid ABC transporter substrate-binding protein [Desulfobacteraceae bacterium]